MGDLHDALRADLTAIRNRLDTVAGYRVLNPVQREAVLAVQRRADLALARLAAPPVTPPPPDPPPVEPPPPPVEPSPTNPYPTHPVHRPIPADARQLEGITLRPGIHLDAGYESPMVYPAWTGVTWTVVLPGHEAQVLAPADIRAGAGSDHALVILDMEAGVEYRMWRANVDAAARRITCQNGNVIRLGTHEVLAGGDVTGSGMSYTVGMAYLDELAAGVISHALRISASYIGGRFVPPATKTDQTGAAPPEAPMGARVYLPADVDLAPILAAIDAALAHPAHRRIGRALATAIQSHGMILSDGGGFANTVYVQGAPLPALEAAMGPATGSYDGYPTWNAVGRAVSAALPWDRMRVTDDPRLAEWA
ncbi:hypothetical protein [Microcystis phage Mae-JY09]